MKKFYLLSAVTTTLCTLIYGADNDSMTPAERHNQQVEQNMNQDKIDNSPKSKAMEKNTTLPAQQEYHQHPAYQSLSPKNKAVYDTLDEKDRNAVNKAHAQGQNHQEVIMDTLKKDQKQNAGKETQFFWTKKEKQQTPAQKSMSPSKRKHEENTY